jgi:dihydroneopterin aldolase
MVAEVISGESCKLLERVGARIADGVLAMDGRAARVHVSVWKLRPPVPVDLARAGVTVVRDRA